MASQKKQAPQNKSKDDFESVAKRLECDDDSKRFEERLGKIAKAKTTSKRDAKTDD